MPAKRKPVEPIEPEPELEASRTPADEETREKRARGKGVFLPIQEDGSVDFKRLRGEDWKVDAARKALQLSGGGDAVKEGVQVSEDFVRGLYSGVEAAIQGVGTMFLKWPKDLASKMVYSDLQKTRLLPPTKAVIEKLAPAWLIKHQEIATLAVVLAAETQAMVKNALVLYIEDHPELLRQAEPPKPNGHDAEPDKSRTIA
jgi:hypothetical protein